MDPEADEKNKKIARETIEGLKKKLSEGADFGELASKESQCASSSQGGDLGFFSREQMVPSFSDAAFALQPGEMSDIVETQFGYHLILAQEKKAAGIEAYDDVKENIKKFLVQVAFEQEQQKYMQGLREAAEIKRLL